MYFGMGDAAQLPDGKYFRGPQTAKNIVMPGGMQRHLSRQVVYRSTREPIPVMAVSGSGNLVVNERFTLGEAASEQQVASALANQRASGMLVSGGAQADLTVGQVGAVATSKYVWLGLGLLLVYMAFRRS